MTATEESDAMEVLFDERVATIVMDEGKANALDPTVIGHLRDAVRQAVEGGARAIVLVGVGNTFSAGLNLPVVAGLDRAGLEAFMRDFMDALIEMLAAPVPMVAAINGHAIAGGCILAMACDHRVMAHGDYRIGLNEIDLGIRFPVAALEVARAALPRAAWSEMLLRGHLPHPEEAVGMGFIHQLADRKLLLQSALAVAREYASKPPHAMALLRADLNAPLIARIRARFDASVQEFVECWNSPDTRELVAAMCEQLAVRR